MSNENRTTISFGGFGLGTILTLIFLVLKLCGVISWGWFFVFLPIIISVSLWILLIVIVVVVSLIGYKRGWWD